MTGAFSPRVVAAGAGATVKLFGVRFTYKVVSDDCGGTLAVMEVDIPAGILVKPHSHAREDEFSLVQSGTVVESASGIRQPGPAKGTHRQRENPEP